MSIKKNFLKTRVGGINETTVRELLLFAENDGELYRQSLAHLHASMGKFYTKGEFDLHKSVISHRSFMDRAAKKYGEDGIFSSAEKWAAAYEMAEQNLEEMKLGHFIEMRN
ncbi:MAG: hypothetical protein KAQ71_08355 [Desulfobulbaceae bacterium]|nr:hypothetical protein [Desulfobulbaceae bacterium]